MTGPVDQSARRTFRQSHRCYSWQVLTTSAVCFAVGLLCLRTVADEPDQSSEPDIHPAVYIQHVGQSDKPLFPVVFAVDRPSDDELLRVLRDQAEVKFSQVILVSPDSFQLIVDQTSQSLRRARKPAAPQAFGTFRIVVSTPAADRSGRVDRESALRLFRKISESISPPDHEPINDALDTLRVRLGEKKNP